MQNMFFFAGPKKKIAQYSPLALLKSFLQKEDFASPATTAAHSWQVNLPSDEECCCSFHRLLYHTRTGREKGCRKKIPFLRGSLGAPASRSDQVRCSEKKAFPSVRQCLHDRDHKKGVGSRRGKKKLAPTHGDRVPSLLRVLEVEREKSFCALKRATK